MRRRCDYPAARGTSLAHQDSERASVQHVLRWGTTHTARQSSWSPQNDQTGAPDLTASGQGCCENLSRAILSVKGGSPKFKLGVGGRLTCCRRRGCVP